MALKGFGFVSFQSDSEGVSQTSSQEQDKEGDGKLGPRWVGMCVKRASTLSLPGLQGILWPRSHSPLASSPAHGPCVSSPGALLSSPRLRLGFRASFLISVLLLASLVSHPFPTLRTLHQAAELPGTRLPTGFSVSQPQQSLRSLAVLHQITWPVRQKVPADLLVNLLENL